VNKKIPHASFGCSRGVTTGEGGQRESLVPALMDQMRLTPHRVGAAVAGNHLDDDPAAVVRRHLATVPPSVLVAVVADLPPVVVVVALALDILLAVEELDETAERPHLHVIQNGRDHEGQNENDQSHDCQGQHLPSPKNRVSNLEDLLQL